MLVELADAAVTGLGHARRCATQVENVVLPPSVLAGSRSICKSELA